MDELLHRIDGHFQDISAGQRQSIREIDTLKATVFDVNRHMNGVQSCVTRLQTDVGEMQTNISRLQTEMVEVKTDLRRLGVGFDGLRVSMVNTNTAIVELRGTFASLGVMLKDHARRLGDLEDKQAS
ncbi:MAG: hypothetical protein EB084_25090 [Proteobacteria bacterium]|nr:hypothetical protein [Pseudomonadota bacterium]